jgi:flagellar protein FliO/FliZ
MRLLSFLSPAAVSLPPPLAGKTWARWGLALLAALALGVASAGHGTPALRAGAVVALAAAAGVVAARTARKRASLAAPAPLRVLSRVALSGRTGLALVEAEGRRYLIGFGDGFVTHVGDAGAQPPPSPAGGPP